MREGSVPPDGNILTIKRTDGIFGKMIHRDALTPLVAAVTKMDIFASSCTAFTIDETYDSPSAGNLRTITRFDASQSPADRVEIIIYNNAPPSDEFKALITRRMVEAYGEKTIMPRAWMKELEGNIKRGACHMEINENIFKYVFMTRHVINYSLSGFNIRGHFSHSKKRRVEYEVDTTTGNLVGYRIFFFDGKDIKDMSGSKLKLLEVVRTYNYISANVIPVSGSYRLRCQSPDADGRQVDRTLVRIIGDYKKVTCYDDRLRVDIGEGMIVDDGPK
ncbi:hypothetical protein AW736_19685 [Termitidicoccus mucosus]|uniref:Uncharacterized protein n=2 Tax=Termitidicoccus mucosus TaxID=1184151 RepID=A0A178IGR1_9BACT|nr:hypothetical protein AW736_19685 [Opitutaceae bacterium TSB47]